MRLRNLISRQFQFKVKSSKNFSSKTSSNDIIFPDRSIEYFINPNKYTFIDKTKFIEKALSNTNTEIYYQPNSFGKTFNLDILKYFLSDLNKVDNIVDKSKRKTFFEKTEIFNNKDLVEKHFQKHPVIYLNFKELDEKKFEDNIEKLKLLLNSQVDQIFQYEAAKDLNAYELKIFEEFLSNIKSVSNQFLTNMPKELARILSKLSGNNAFILINNFDYPLVNSYGRKCYEEFKPFLEALVKNTFKNNNFIYKGILTGVSELEHQSTFSSLINHNLKSYSFKDFQDAEEANKYFGISLTEDKIANLDNNSNNKSLKDYAKTISLFNTNNAKNNLSYINFFNCNKNESLRGLSEESLMKLLNIESISDFLNLNALFANVINDSSKDYLSGYKLLNILNNKAENFLKNFTENTNQKKHNFYLDANLSFDISAKTENKFFTFENPLRSSAFLSYLLANNVISLSAEGAKSNIEIPNVQSALLIKSAFAKQTFHLDDYDRKLAYNFYRYLYFNKASEYFQEIKNIFDLTGKAAGAASKKISPFSKQVNLNFKSEKELENYFVHIMTLELNIEDSAENLNIFGVDDYENTKVSELLKEFTLITFDDRKFAIFIRFNKHKLSAASPHAEDLNEIDEVQNNDVIKKSKKRIPKVDLKDLTTTLQTINQEKISKLKKEEALGFLKHISTDFQAVSFVSVSNYKNYLEFAAQTFLIDE